MDDNVTMSSPAATRPPWAWKLLLFGASLAALGVSTLAYLGDDSAKLLPVRLMLALMTPVVMVGGGFAAGQMR